MIFRQEKQKRKERIQIIMTTVAAGRSKTYDLVYIAVFAGFSGGIGALLGNAGGYIIGFIFSALVMWAIEHVFGRKPVVQIISMIVGLIVCYAFGTAWFMFAYTRSTGPVGLMAVLGWCVFPFIIPDLIKIALAYVLSGKVRKYAR